MKESSLEERKAWLEEYFGRSFKGDVYLFGRLGYIRVSDLLFKMSDVRDYLENSSNLTSKYISLANLRRNNVPGLFGKPEGLCGKIRYWLMAKEPVFSTSCVDPISFKLENLEIVDIGDSGYDKVYRSHSFTGPNIHISHVSRIPIGRRDFVLSDSSGKLLTYMESDEVGDKSWSHIVFSQEGDAVDVEVSPKKETDGEIAFCRLYSIRNHSLEGRLR